jgi:hypothetical protein
LAGREFFSILLFKQIPEFAIEFKRNGWLCLDAGHFPVWGCASAPD